MTQNIYGTIIKGLLHWYQCILSVVGISTDTRKLMSFDIQFGGNIHRYHCNNPICLYFNIVTQIVHVLKKIMYLQFLWDRKLWFQAFWITSNFQFLVRILQHLLVEVMNSSQMDHLHQQPSRVHLDMIWLDIWTCLVGVMELGITVFHSVVIIWASPYGNAFCAICEKQRRRSACAFVQSDQHL